VVDLLVELGIDIVACNPGATFRGLHDSIVNHGRGRIQMVECTHEEISVAIAHGYAKAAGKPMAAAVHDVVGLQHASMAIFNAWCDRVPVLVLGATGPMDTTRRRPWIDWIHTANVQGSLVRDYTKWDDQPASLAAVPQSLIRGLQVARTAPAGPVYICLDAEIQEHPVADDFTTLRPGDFAAPAPLAPAAEAVHRLARWLVESERPVVVADRAGRDPKAVSLLVRLAELLALPVVDGPRVSLNFPTDHPLNLTGAEGELLGAADLVLGLESRDLYGALHRTDRSSRRTVSAVPPGARVAQVTLDPLAGGSWTGDFQRLQRADLTILAELPACLGALLPECERLAAEAALADLVEARRRRLSAHSADLRQAWRAEAASASAQVPIARSALAAAVGEALGSRDFVLANGTLDGWTHRLWSLRQADRYLGLSGGAGLGYGLGAAIGAALAQPGRLVLDIQSDGDALYAPGALWTLAHERLPVLVVMDNNRAYQNSVGHAEMIARTRGRPLENASTGTSITDPVIDFATLARAFGVHGEGPVTDPAELPGALARALAVVEAGRPALVDVVIEA
jgi:thiamine pyrophosphate-dependent acetolactate synthase large subunit-like protein